MTARAWVCGRGQYLVWGIAALAACGGAKSDADAVTAADSVAQNDGDGAGLAAVDANPDSASSDSTAGDAAAVETGDEVAMVPDTQPAADATPLPKCHSPADCDDELPCTTDKCNPFSGCVHLPLPASTACDDGDPCTAGDHCQASQCVPGEAICQCQTAADCGPFEDGNLCNGKYYCDQSKGVPYTCQINPKSVVDCSKAQDGPCQKNTCIPATGACQLVTAPENTPCSDGNACTQGDHCGQGLCLPGTDTCSCKADADCAKQEDGDACNGTLFCNLATGLCELNPATVVHCFTVADTDCRKNLCHPLTGKCQFKDVGEGQPCNDGNPCTPSETCQQGQCAATTNACQCQTDKDCAAKDDGNACNGTLYCDVKQGLCVVNPATVVHCDTDDDPACLRDVCDSKTGQCAPSPLPKDGTACDDGNACTPNSSCQGGSCKATVNTCSCEQDGDCAGKDDGDLCNGTLYCDKSAGNCAVNPATVVACPNAFDEPCLTSQCSPKSGKCSMKPARQGNQCGGGSVCAAGGWCAAGVCAIETAVVCQCTADADCGKFEDGDACNGTLYCDKKAPKPMCTVNPASVIVCPQGGLAACQKNVCQPATGKCAVQPGPGACDDGKVCTSKDACLAGNCVGLPKTCDDGQVCTADACQEPFGCVFLPAAATCDDGDVCTASDACLNGACKGGKPACSDGNPCTLDSCASEIGCMHLPVAATCSDGNACTSGDTCNQGVCQPSATVTCSDGNPCTDDACDPKSGCTFKPNTAACDDGDVCSLAQACKGGLCVATKMQNCDDGNVCTDDSCDAKAGCVLTPNTKPCDATTCTSGSVCKSGGCVAGPVVKLGAGLLDVDAGGPVRGVAAFANGDLAVVGGDANGKGFASRIGPNGKPQWTWESPSSYTALHAVRAAPDGMVVALGSGGVTSAVVQPFAPDGKPGTPTLTADVAGWAAIATHPAGGYWAVSHPDGYSKAYVARMDAQLAVVSLQLLCKGCIATGVATLADGRAVVVGTAPGGLTRGLIALHGNDGKFESKQEVPHPTTHVQLTAVAPRKGHGFVAVGYAGSLNSGPVQSLVVGLDSSGNIAWQKLLPDDGSQPNQHLHAVLGFADGGFVTAGAIVGVAGNYDGLLRRGDAAGNTIWQQVYGNSEAENLLTLTLRADGGLAAGGTKATKPWLIRADAWGNASCLSTGQCLDLSAGDCDDQQPCTADTCSAATGCQHQQLAEGAPCGNDVTCDGKGKCGVPVGMRAIAAGTAWMGCLPSDVICASDEKPQHVVQLSDFAIDLTEVTTDAYTACVKAGVCTAPPGTSVNGANNYGASGRGDHPVNSVTWTQASDYCKWRGKRLPTEAEWEKAARGGCNAFANPDVCKAALTLHPWGNAGPDCKLAHLFQGGDGCGTKITAPVGSKPAGDTPTGLHDMGGNVSEWCSDWYAAGTYASSLPEDPTGPATGTAHVTRGSNLLSVGGASRTSARGSSAATGISVGFRCAKSL